MPPARAQAQPLAGLVWPATAPFTLLVYERTGRNGQVCHPGTFQHHPPTATCCPRPTPHTAPPHTHTHTHTHTPHLHITTHHVQATGMGAPPALPHEFALWLVQRINAAVASEHVKRGEWYLATMARSRMRGPRS